MELGTEGIGITGALVSYYFICHRKVWLHAKGLDFENVTGNANVIKGKILHETRFPREHERERQIDSIKIDFLKYGDEVVVHEVKKSRKFEDAHLWQLKYYIFVLKHKGVNCRRGILHYPASIRRVEVEMTAEDEEVIERAVSEIREILNQQTPPLAKKRKFCLQCAYWDFCAV
ncbi:hypothetical protein MHLNE_04400 [Moorella humiferrea]|uniref:CRISPR-associated protein Cas4 n=1 Tax=Neomoorella humiferrea TaxID=676965 RepID=UPI0030D5647F